MSNILAGGLSREDEHDISAELDALIAEETAQDIQRLPDVPERTRQGERSLLVDRI